MRRRGQPVPGEFVIARVDRISPNSVAVQLVEYSSEGLIHVSEVARGWVRDIRSHLRPGQVVVGVVLSVQPLTLSLKRVSPTQAAHRLQEFKRDSRAERLLERAARALGKDLDAAYAEIGFELIERYGSLWGALRLAAARPRALKLPPAWQAAIADMAKALEAKQIELSATLELRSYAPQGINIIKSILKRASDAGIEVRYIAAPQYLLKWRTADPKRGGAAFSAKLDELVRTAAAAGAAASYKIVK